MTPHPAQASVDGTRRLAKLAMIAMGAVGGLEALVCLFNDLDAPGILCQLLCYAAWIAAAVLYCRWLYRAYGDVALLQGTVRFKPGEAVASFFLPFVGLWRPYRVMVELYEASDPRGLPSPGGGLTAGDSAPVVEKAFPVRSWWAAWLLAPVATGILENVSSLSTAITLLSNVDKLTTDPTALLVSQESAGGDGLLRFFSAIIHLGLAARAILVVRGVAARQGERLRRLEMSAAAAPALAP